MIIRICFPREDFIPQNRWGASAVEIEVAATPNPRSIKEAAARNCPSGYEIERISGINVHIRRVTPERTPPSAT